MSTFPAFLSTLCEADVAALAERWTVRTYGPNELIIAHGHSDRDVFFILEGQARVTLFSGLGREVSYRDIQRGDIFGELAAIDGRERSASVIALEPTRTARLSAVAFEEIVKSHPALTWALLQHLSGLLRRMTDRVFEFSTLVVRKRLVCELLRRADENEPPSGEAIAIPIPTHFELAANISTHREAVAREMSTLAKRGLIERHGRSLILRDLAALEAMAGKK